MLFARLTAYLICVVAVCVISLGYWVIFYSVIPNSKELLSSWYLYPISLGIAVISSLSLIVIVWVLAILIGLYRFARARLKWHSNNQKFDE